MLLLWKVMWNLCRWHMFHRGRLERCYHRWENRTCYSTRTSLEDAIHLDWSYLLRLLQAIHLLCDRSVLCYPNVLFARNPVSPGTFSLWHISVKINVIYPQPILDLWPPSIAEGWCSKLSYFYFLFKIICHIHEVITLFLKRHQPIEPKQSINHLYPFRRLHR